MTMLSPASPGAQPGTRRRSAYIFFSVHEELFHRVALRLREHGVDSFAGFVWGRQQERAIASRGIDYDRLLVFSRDLRPQIDDGRAPDLDWLARREQELGISLQRMLAAERHLLHGRTFTQIMRMAEVALREIAAAYDRTRPDFVFSEDVSCFHSYAHFVLARERGIPFWCIGGGRLPYRVSVYSAGMQRWERVEAIYSTIRRRGLSSDERREAEKYLETFRAKPRRPTGMEVRAAPPKLNLGELQRLGRAVMRYIGDPRDPTVLHPGRLLRQRIERIARVRIADATGRFEDPVPGERYVLYPIHFQPEASTLVQAPMYLDQVALLQDIAKSLPAGHRLYVKEHVSNRGRRPLSFYDAIREIPSVRLLGPDADTWSLIQNASAIAVITGTMGWEGLLFDKPVVSFGEVFYNMLPHVHRASQFPKDRWYEVFQRAIHHHQPDREALLALLSAMHQGSYPGFMKNPNTFPEVLDNDNVENLVTALVTAAQL